MDDVIVNSPYYPAGCTGRGVDGTGEFPPDGSVGRENSVGILFPGTSGYKKIRSPQVLGVISGKHESTVRGELRRGMGEHEMANIPFVRREYYAEYAQSDAQIKRSAKRPGLRLEKDWALVQEVSHLIKNCKYFPCAAIAHFNNTRWPSGARICEKTLYNYIEQGCMGELRVTDLLFAGGRTREG